MLDCLFVQEIIYQLVEITLNLVIFSQLPLRGVVSDVQLKVGTCRTAETAVSLDEFQTAVEVKPTVKALHNVFPLRY